MDRILSETGSSGNRLGYKRLIRRYVDQLSMKVTKYLRQLIYEKKMF